MNKQPKKSARPRAPKRTTAPRPVDQKTLDAGVRSFIAELVGGSSAESALISFVEVYEKSCRVRLKAPQLMLLQAIFLTGYAAGVTRMRSVMEDTVQAALADVKEITIRHVERGAATKGKK